jgi:hypothetical protein
VAMVVIGCGISDPEEEEDFLEDFVSFFRLPNYRLA